MSQSFIRSFHFCRDQSGKPAQPTLFPECDAVEIAISPNDPDSNSVRITLATHVGQMTMALTRVASCRNGPPEYASWRIAGLAAQKLCSAWHCANVLRMVHNDHHAVRLEMDGITGILSAPHHADRVQWADAHKWAAEGDPIFQVRLDAWRHTLRVLRGPGRTLKPGTEADILIQGHLPMSINGVDLSGVRILQLRRTSCNIRTDVAARCSPSMIETIGMRFCLNTMMRSVKAFDCFADDTMIHVGFDPDIGCSWISVLGEMGNETVLQIDPSTKLHSATPAAGLLNYMEANH